MDQQLNTQLNEGKAENPSLFGIFTSPIETFKRIRQNPKVLIPLIFVVIISTIASAIMVMSVDFVQLSESQGISAEEAKMVAGIAKISGFIGGSVGVLFAILISSLIYLAIVKIAGKDARFKQLFSMTSYIAIVTSIGTLLNSIILYFVGGNNPEQTFTSLNSLVGAEGALGAFLSAFEVFNIWGTILTALGLQYVAKLSKGASWAIAVILFIIGAILMTLTGLSQPKMG
jgi:Yip1 domain